METDRTYDIVIPFHSKDAAILPYCIAGIRHHLSGVRCIFVISAADPEEDGVEWIPEHLFPFPIGAVQEKINSADRAGWYLQQLLKLYCFRIIPGILDRVLLFDSDIIVCRPIEFIDTSGNHLLDVSEDQQHEAYFDHACAVLGDRFERFHERLSGITDHMMVYRPVMEAMLRDIESYTGREAWIAVLEAVDPSRKDGSGGSEYELYFNYALKWYPAIHRVRFLHKRFGRTFHDLTVFQDVDLMSFHAWWAKVGSE